MQSIVLFLISCLFWVACKTSTRRDASELNSNPGPAYGTLAQERVRLAFENLALALKRVNPDLLPAQTEPLLAAVTALNDMIDIFVHVLPMQDDADPYLSLRATLTSGADSLTRFHAIGTPADSKLYASLRAPVLRWVEEFASAANLRATEDYLESMNRSLATRRTIAVLEKTCWGDVDNIPDLRAPAGRGLKEFMKALLSAYHIAAGQAVAITEILSAEQTPAFQSTRIKARAIVAIAEYFPDYFDGDSNLQGQLPQVQRLVARYDIVGKWLNRRESLLKAKHFEEARILGEKIKQEWQEVKVWQTHAPKVSKP